MARSFIQGGVSATGLATGRPYFRRIVRIGGTGTPNRQVAGANNGGIADDLTCKVDGNGDLDFTAGASAISWDADVDTGSRGEPHLGGELLFVEFPATTRTLSVQLEEGRSGDADHQIRLKVMLAAEGQKVHHLDENGVITTATSIMNPITSGNFIELSQDGDTATINARTKGVFILIQKYDGITVTSTNTVVDGDGGHVNDAAVILVTAVLDHEGFDTAGKNGVVTKTVASARAAATGTYDGDNLKKIWHKLDGVG